MKSTVTTTKFPDQFKHLSVMVVSSNQLEKKAFPEAEYDFYVCVRPFLILGRTLGLLPWDGLQQRNYEAVRHRKFGVKSLVSVSIMAGLLFCILISTICMLFAYKHDSPAFAWELKPIVFFSNALFGYAFLFWNSSQFFVLLRTWHELSLSFNSRDPKLKRDVKIIMGVIFASALLENMLQQCIQTSFFDWISSCSNDTNSFQEDFDPIREYYFRAQQPRWSTLFPYNPALTLLMFVWNKCALYSWNYMDLLIMVFSQALSYQFRDLIKYAHKFVMADDTRIVRSSCITAIPMEGQNQRGKPHVFQNTFPKQRQNLIDPTRSRIWEIINSDFEVLLALLNDCKSFLSPVVFVSYAVNVFYAVVHLHMGLKRPDTQEADLATGVYRVWAFLHIVGRGFCVTLYAARVNEAIVEFLDLYRKCPPECYTINMERVEKFCRTKKMGLTGLNCFVVTKPFMLKLVGVVLTFEILLLQTSGFSFI